MSKFNKKFSSNRTGQYKVGTPKRQMAWEWPLLTTSLVIQMYSQSYWTGISPKISLKNQQGRRSSSADQSAQQRGEEIIWYILTDYRWLRHILEYTELARNEEDVKLSGKLQRGQAQWDLESEWRQAQLVSNEPDPDSLEHRVDEAWSTMKKHQD